MSLRPRRVRARAALLAAVAAALVLGAAVTALAYYTATGVGGASASVGTLAAPSITSATPGAGTVSLSWSAITPPGSGSVSYYVQRDGGAASAACPSAASPANVTSCTDTGVSVGSHSYTVTAVWRTWTGTSASANATVAYGPVSQLVVTTQPAGATGGTAFTTQPVVTAKDAGGNTVTTYAGTVTLSIKAGSPSGTLSGCSSTLTGGVTSFSGCKIDKAGSNYKLTATDGTRSVDTNAFNVTAGPVAQLAFTTQPAGAVAGTAFTTQPSVTAQDAVGNTVTTYSGTITLSITSGTGSAGATLDNCTRSLTNGVTSWTGCNIKKSGNGYKVHATDGTRTTDSAAFDVTPGAVASLAYTTQPSNSTGGVAFPTQPVVTALDSQGNVATGYGGTVSLSIKHNSGTSGAILSGCSGLRSNGVTTFGGCKIDKAGSNYKLTADDGTRSVDSSQFDITIGPAARFVMTAASATPTVATNDALTITATDLGGNTVTSYTGVHNLTFGGVSASPSGTASTVFNSSGAAVAFGTSTPINFSNGVTTTGSNNATMVLHRAGTLTITATDGAISDNGSLSVTASAGAAAKLAWTHVTVSAGTLSVPCLFTCTDTGIGSQGTFTANVSVTDVDGNTVSGLGSGHTVTVSNGTGSGGFTAPTAGTSVTLTISGSGLADSTAQFTFRAQSGSWSTNTFGAATASGTVYTAASATVTRQ